MEPIAIIIEKTSTGFSAYAEDYPIFSTGKTLFEMMANCLEAVNLYFKKQGVRLEMRDIQFKL